MMTRKKVTKLNKIRLTFGQSFTRFLLFQGLFSLIREDKQGNYTLFFSTDVINSLRVNGTLHFPSHEQCRLWLKRSLFCVHCGYQPKSIRDYKDKHVAYHNFDTWEPPKNVSVVPTGFWLAQPWTFFEEWGNITATPE
jgi:hypothetical protein